MADASLEDGSASEIPSDGIPTTYAGVLFRSRLEAKWGAFADLAGWEWVHEPFDGTGYIPDFCFTIAGRPVLAEVKPTPNLETARTYLPKIITGIGDLWKHDVIVCGIDPLHTLYIDFLHGPTDYHTSAARFTACSQCGSLDLHPAEWEMDCNSCAKSRRSRDSATELVRMLWRKAGNDTRWNPAA